MIQQKLHKQFLQDLSQTSRSETKTAKGQALLELLSKIDDPHRCLSDYSPLQAIFKHEKNNHRLIDDLKDPLLNICFPKIKGPIEFLSKKSSGERVIKTVPICLYAGKKVIERENFSEFVASKDGWKYIAKDYERYCEGKLSNAKNILNAEVSVIFYIHHHLSSEFLFKQTPRIFPWPQMPCFSGFKETIGQQVAEFLQMGAPVDGFIEIENEIGFPSSGSLSFLAYSLRERNIPIFTGLLSHGADISGVHYRNNNGAEMDLDGLFKELCYSNGPNSKIHQMQDIYKAHCGSLLAKSTLNEILPDFRSPKP